MIFDKKSPINLFLLDGVGALLSASMLVFSLVFFQDLIGMPKRILFLLSFLAICFAIYSLACFFVKVNKWRIYLAIIAVVNLLYCFLTSFFVISYWSNMKPLGFLYFFLEIIVIIIIVIIELRTVFEKI